MNYSGKFDAKVSADGSALHSNGDVHVETVHATHAPADAIIVQDAQLLFNGEFRRSGVDLILSRNDQEQVFHDYFKGEKRAALSSPDGAHLSGDLVNALTGHVEYAQADGSASVSHVIGHVSKLVGTATAIRNGVSVILNNGDNVEKGDVVQSGSNSTLGITFIDGTVFGLSSNARMVLNEMVYDPNGSNNSSLLSLVAGTISFVAGETAKHGDMKVDTPVATMGIRGTAVLVEIDFTVPGQGGTPDAKFQVLVEPDGTTGSYILFDKTTLTPLAVVDKAGLQINISNGILSQTMNPLSPEIQKLITDVFSLKFSDNSNPNTNTHFTDSIVPQALPPIKLASGPTATPFILISSDTPINTPISPPPPPPVPHIDQAPLIVASGNFTTAHTGTAKSTGFDTVSGPIRFTDINAGDRPTVTAHFVSLKLLDAQHNDITATLTPQQLAAVEAQLVVNASPSNNNNGTATWTYNVADSAFDFLTVGETLTLTYDAVVNNNFLPFEQQAEALFTITINGPSIVEWIHPTGDLWSIGSNWNSGTVPTADDDVIIPAEHIPGGSGLYDVSIVAPAAARTLTLNANNTTGGQVINHSTLTIGETLTIFNDGVLSNLESGSVSVGGQIELLNQSSIMNSGFITLGQGGDFKDQSSVTNSGTIELAGGTLNVDVDIANSGGIIQVDGDTTLKLNGAAINGGTINDNGPIDVTADSSINGTSIDNGEDGTTTVDALLNGGGVMVESGVTLTLDNVTVSGTIFVDAAAGATIQVDGGTTLTLDDVMVIGGTITDNGTIEVGTETTLTLNGVAINGGTINDNGTIDVTDDSSINGTSIDNGEDGTTTVDALLNNGEVTIESDVTLTLDNVTVTGTTFTDTAGGATIQVDGGTTLTLDDVTVTGGTITDNGTIQVDTETTLTLSGVAINGGTINDNGTIDVTDDSSIDGTTATNAVLNNGEVMVESDVTLTLDNVTVNGTTFTDTAGGAILQIGVGTTLTLEGGATIDGGTINDGTAIIDVKDAARIDSNATLNNGRVTIESGATLALGNVTVNGTAFTGLATSSTIQVDDGDTLTLNSASISGGTVTDNGTMDIGGAVIFQSGVAVNGGAMSIAKGATLDIENAVTGTGATLNGVKVINSGTIQVDAPGAGTTVISLVLDGGTTVTGGTLLIHVGFPIGSIQGTVEIGTGGATLDHVTVTNNNSLTVDDGSTLMLSHVAINGGIINDGVFDSAGGTIDVVGDSSINGISTDNGDGFTTVSAILNNGEVTVESGVTLTLDNVTVNGTVFTGLDTSSIIQVDDGDTLTLNGAAIIGGTIIATGTLDLENVTINGGTLGGAGTIATAAGNADSTLNGVTIASGALVTADVGTLDLTGIITNNGEIDATTGTLDLENATINGGTLGGTGTIATAAGNTDSTLNGVIIASGALVAAAVGTLDLTGIITNNGELDATTGTLDLENVTVNGGTLGGAGTIATAAGNTDSTLNGVIMASGSKVTAAVGTLDLTGIIANNGEIDAALGGALDLENATINGGTLGVFGVMDSSGVSFITAATIVNSGIIEVTSGTLTIDPTPMTNAGTIEVAGDGTLVLSGETINNSVNGKIQVDATSGTLDLENTTINGGTLGGAGTIATAAGNIDSTLNGVTIASGALVAAAVGTLDLTGTITNHGEIDAGLGGTLDMENATIDGGTLGGAGTIATAAGNTESTLNGITIASGSKVTAAVGTLDLTGIITNHGEIDAALGGMLDLKNATVNGGTLDVFGVLDSSGISFITGATIINSGTIEVASGTLTIDPTPVTNTGTIEVAGDGTLVLSGETINNGANGKIEVDATSGTLDLENATINGGTLGGAGTIATAAGNTVSTLNGVTIASGSKVTAAVGTLDLTGTITNHGEIDAAPGGTLDLENATINGGTLGGAGTIVAVSGDNTLNGVTIASGTKLTTSNLATLDLTGTITNNGEIDATITKVNIAGNITGTGSIELFNHAKLEIGGSVSSGQTVTFSAPGDAATLILDDSHDFHGKIVGLVEYPNESQENHVDLKDLTFRSGHMSAHFNGSADTVTVSNGIDSVTLHLSGGPFDPSFELARDATGGTLIDDPSASSGLVTIDSGKTLDISVASTATVSFTNSNGNTGELVLDNSKAFTGQIVGFAGDGTISNSDLINLADVNIADVAIDKTTYTDNGNGTGTLTLHDANGQTLDSLTFAGSYQLANFTIENDGSGHTLIVDPPASTGPAVGGVVMNDPGPVASSTIVATAPNQTLSGFAASDNFAFNFTGVGHAIVADFHPATDTLQFSNPIFASAQAAFDATHDDGHGNSVVAIDAHDTITLAGILKAQLHVGDFHVV